MTGNLKACDVVGNIADQLFGSIYVNHNAVED